jgi:hypothetical protein
MTKQTPIQDTTINTSYLIGIIKRLERSLIDLRKCSKNIETPSHQRVVNTFLTFDNRKLLRVCREELEKKREENNKIHDYKICKHGFSLNHYDCEPLGNPNQILETAEEILPLSEEEQESLNKIISDIKHSLIRYKGSCLSRDRIILDNNDQIISREIEERIQQRDLAEAGFYQDMKEETIKLQDYVDFLVKNGKSKEYIENYFLIPFKISLKSFEKKFPVLKLYFSNIQITKS